VHKYKKNEKERRRNGRIEKRRKKIALLQSVEKKMYVCQPTHTASSQ
jgi:hypothetical protein